MEFSRLLFCNLIITSKVKEVSQHHFLFCALTLTGSFCLSFAKVISITLHWQEGWQINAPYKCHLLLTLHRVCQQLELHQLYFRFRPLPTAGNSHLSDSRRAQWILSDSDQTIVSFKAALPSCHLPLFPHRQSKGCVPQNPMLKCEPPTCYKEGALWEGIMDSDLTKKLGVFNERGRGSSLPPHWEDCCCEPGRTPSPDSEELAAWLWISQLWELSEIRAVS